MSISEAFPGGCYMNDVLIKCAWEKADCGAFSFRSYAQIQDTRTKCHDNHRQYAGMCVDEILCTSDASNCADPSQFVDESPFCNIEYNRYADSNSSPFHLTGSCSVGSTSTCVYGRDACTAAGGTFTTPSQMQYSDSCTCDNVKLGACRSSSNAYTCAVSADACDASSTFVEWHQLNDDIDCRLCNGFTKEARNWVNERGVVVPEDYNRLPTKPWSSDENPKMVFIGIAVGVLLTALVCFCSGRYCCRRSKKEFDTQDGKNGENV